MSTSVNYEWLQSPAKINALFQQNLTLLENLSVTKGNPKKSQNFIDSFNILWDTALQIEPKALNNKQLEKLSNALLHRMPAIVDQTRTSIIKIHAYSPYEVSGVFLKHSKKLFKLYQSQLLPLAKITTVSTTPEQQELRLGNSIPEQTAERIVLRAQELLNKKNTSEDDFLLEQIARSYIPEALKLFNGLKGSSAETIEEATRIFNEQLNLISVQVEAVAHRQEQNSLSHMKQQLTFLREKVLADSAVTLT